MTHELSYFGLTHRTAPLSVRERILARLPEPQEMLTLLEGSSSGAMVLRTCERLESYVSQSSLNVETWGRQLAAWSGAAPLEFLPFMDVRHDVEAARHLLRVAGGLDSRILGEPHILGQARSSFLHAQKGGFLDATLSALGRAALHTGKRIRHETALGRGGGSIVSLTLRRLSRDVGSLTDRTVLVIGTGALATDLAAALATRRTGRILVVSRLRDRAEALADRCGGVGFTMDELPCAIALADAVVACSTTSSYVVNPVSIDVRRTRSLNIIDLGVPRNVDPSVTSLNCVRLVPMEELMAQLQVPDAAVVEAETIVADELARFRDWQRNRRIAPLIAQLMRNACSEPFDDLRSLKRSLHLRIVELRQGAAA